MTSYLRRASWTVLVALLAFALVARGQAQTRQRDEVRLRIGDAIGRPPSFAVPDCLALTPDETTAEAARTIAQVLWDDLNFER